MPVDPWEAAEQDRTCPDLPPGLRHDLLNVLNAVRGYVELLVADLPDGQQREWASRALSASEEALELAGRLPRSRPAAVLSRPLVFAAPAAGARFIPLLEVAGWEVSHALSAREAVSALRAAPGAWQVALIDAALRDGQSVVAAAQAAGVRTVILDFGCLDALTVAAELERRLTHPDEPTTASEKGV